MSTTVISSLSGNHRVVHWLDGDNWPRRTYTSQFYSISPYSPLLPICACVRVGFACSETTKQRQTWKEKLMAANVLCIAHNDTVSYLSPQVDTCCHIFSECACRYLPYPQQSQLNQVPLLPKINPLKLEWQVEHFEATQTHTHTHKHTNALTVPLSVFFFLTFSFQLSYSLVSLASDWSLLRHPFAVVTQMSCCHIFMLYSWCFPSRLCSPWETESINANKSIWNSSNLFWGFKIESRAKQEDAVLGTKKKTHSW